MAEINIWKPDSELGSEGRKSHVKTTTAADKEGGNVGWGSASSLGKSREAAENMKSSHPRKGYVI